MQSARSPGGRTREGSLTQLHEERRQAEAEAEAEAEADVGDARLLLGRRASANSRAPRRAAPRRVNVSSGTRAPARRVVLLLLTALPRRISRRGAHT